MRNLFRVILPALLLSSFPAAGVVVSPDIAAPAAWSVYPAKAQKITPCQEMLPGKKVVEIDMSRTAGFALINLPEMRGMALEQVSFLIKKAPNCTKDTQEVMLQDRDGEFFFRSVKLTGEFQRFDFPVSKFTQYVYGGAKIVDGKLNAAALTRLRFNNFPAGHAFFIADLQLTYGEIASDGSSKVKIPSATAADAGKWFGWPQKAIDVTAESGALQFDMRKDAGHVSIKLPPANGRELQLVRMKLRSLPGSALKKIPVMLLEDDGEVFYRDLALTPEWSTVAFSPAEMRQFIYGGAKIKDKKLDPSRIHTLRFNGYPKGAFFAVADIELIYGPQIAAGRPYRILERQVEKSNPVKKTFPGIGDITVKGANFSRNNLPYFMLGAWQLDQEGPPWICRALGVDVMVYNADEIYSLYPPRRNAAGELEVKWSDNPWYEAIIVRFLRNKVNFWHEHKAGPEFSVLRRFPEFADVRNGGHFVAYDPYHPDGEKFYREMFKSWMQYTRKYPIFCYELFNEMVYKNQHASSRRAFASAMKLKYRDIAKANKCWQSNFVDFSKVEIPGYIADGGVNASLPRGALQQREIKQYPALWIDWLKFQEQRCYDAVAKLMPIMREYDNSPAVLSTLQSHMQFMMDYGDIGIKPETVRDFSDFYSHELGQQFINSGSYKNHDYIFNMIMPLMVHDLVRGIAHGKAVFNAESPVSLVNRGAAESDLIGNDAAGLHGEWEFFDGTGQEPAGWFLPEFNTAKWGRAKVPAMWADSGFPACQIGLYRKKFTLPRQNAPLFLNGKGCADSAEIYLNGKKIGESKGYDAKFTIPLTGVVAGENVLAIKIINRYFLNGMYFGGIRGFVSINRARLISESERKLGAREMRAFLWSQAAHGISGVMVSYEGNIFSPPAKIMPKVKAEINSVAPLFMPPENRLAPQCAVVYPLETMRALSHRDYLQQLSHPGTDNILKYYAPLLCYGAGTDVIRNSDIISGQAAGYKALFMPFNIRVPGALPEHLRRYVENGGNIVMGFNSLSVDDDWHVKLPQSALTGNKARELSSIPAIFEGEKLGARFGDGVVRAVVAAEDSQVLARFSDGVPAVTVRKLGKGQVYELTGNFSPESHMKLLTMILQRIGIKPQLSVSGEGAPRAVDRRIFRQGDDRMVIFLHNYEPDGIGVIKSEFWPSGDKFIVRNVATGNTLPGKNGVTWSRNELNNGITLRLNQFDPVVLLIEKASATPWPLRGMAPERVAMLNAMWRDVPPVPGAPTVALTPYFGGTSGNIYGVIPTARKLLTDNSLNVVHHNSDADLAKCDLLIWQQLRFKCKNTAAVVDFVRKGGSLLLLGGAPMTYHSLSVNADLLKAFGLRESTLGGVLYDMNAEDKMKVRIGDIAPHPVTTGVREVVTAASAWLESYPADGKVFLRAPGNSSRKGAVLGVEFAFGKGKVMYLADHCMFRPLNIDDGDNAQLFLNAVNFLLGKSPVKLTAEARRKALFISADMLERAEEAERSGRGSFAVPDCSSSYLRGRDTADLNGLSGADPIVNMLK